MPRGGFHAGLFCYSHKMFASIVPACSDPKNSYQTKREWRETYRNLHQIQLHRGTQNKPVFTVASSPWENISVCTLASALHLPIMASLCQSRMPRQVQYHGSFHGKICQCTELHCSGAAPLYDVALCRMPRRRYIRNVTT
jgi:hypothetical protein